ncbi:B3/4 domain protein [Planctomycetes bacterium Pla163]|uniref:B3/4 domain protein n=1 Tax=Rohdeia mirabilis TaxID=2528008 RepID=A0A518CW51_9BACT|nr:B3/4 domain protein [Planctomycetes bacterium Pla163]
MIEFDDHPLLEPVCFVTEFAEPLGSLGPATSALAALEPGATAPLTSSDDVRAAVRRLLRLGGYRPTGRGKPSAEYLLGAVANGRLGSINPAVDACNAVSLHSGLPISVVDLDRASEPLRVGVAEAGASYVFNRSGQEIGLGGLLCLFDADGPCANAVKDAQRTKTDEGTRRTLSVIWGTNELPGRADDAAAWYRELLAECGATTRSV